MIPSPIDDPEAHDLVAPAIEALGLDDLAERYRPPHRFVLAKEQPRVDEHSATFIAVATFVVLATTGPDGTDASPRGGPPGFVRVLDEHHLAFGDLAGNNRLDSYRNLVQHPEVGMLLLVPGLEATLRVNGRALVTTDPAVLDATAVDGRRPRVAVVVAVRECYLHCAMAVRRAALWDPTTWGGAADRPSVGATFAAHLDLDVPGDQIEADLEADYGAALWLPGGADRSEGPG